MVADVTEVNRSGIIAMTGSPAPPVQPQRLTGFGDSAMNLLTTYWLQNQPMLLHSYLLQWLTARPFSL